MKNNQIELVFVLDRSGSMSGLEEDTIGGYNAFLDNLAKESDVKVTTILFDHLVETLYDGENARHARLNARQYFVRGSTALLDAVGKTINVVDKRQLGTEPEQRPAKTIFVVTTDGMENASTEFSYDLIQKMITRQRTREGWEFIFMGANIDVAAEARKMGIDPDLARSFKSTKAGTRQAYSDACACCAIIIDEK